MKFSADQLDRASKTPLYSQLKQIILEAIWSKELKSGDIFPSEEELSKLFQISKSTVRQCMSELAGENYVEKRRNRGTIVLSRKLDLGYSAKIVGFHERVKQMGMEPRTKLLHLSVSEADRDDAALLQVQNGSKVIRLIRLRYADNLPIVWIDSLLPYDDVYFIMGNNLEQKSLYDLLDQHESSRIDSVLRKAYATESTKEMSKVFDIKESSAMLTVETFAYNALGKIIEYSLSYSPGDRNQYSFTIKR